MDSPPDQPAFRPGAFAPRPITPGCVLEHHGYRIKRYAIHLPDVNLGRHPVGDGVDRILGELPSPARTRARPGVGFLIRHLGAEADYLVLTWFDSENELLQRIYTRPVQPADAWRESSRTASFCVWDEQVIHHEREAYVRHVLTDTPDLDAYLADTLTVE
ncbi:MAG: isochorismatase [Phycisphaerales bacterium JB040]